MKLLPVRLYLLILVLFTGLSTQAQRFDSLLNVLDSRYPQEKLYLHFDRALYNPGETIWFKAYVFAGAYPSNYSKTVYAELLDEQGKLLERKSAPVFQGGAAAAFNLPEDIKSNTVYIRAYTRWMLNFDSSFLFVKPIPVASKAKPTGPATATTPAAFLQFFPEGGNLVAGISSKVAFKATDSRGLPIPVRGDIVTVSGKKITSFNSLHDGMGFFTLQPEAGEQYKATWKDQSGKSQETNLPSYLASGVVVRVTNEGSKIDFALERSADLKLTNVHVVGQMHQQLLYRAKANLASRTTAAGSIPLENIPGGIVQVTVFTDDEKPLAERIVFVNQDDYYFITDLNAATKGLQKRAKNVIQIDVPDTIACNLSIAVTDASLNPPVKNEDDIFSHLLLTSDIKGYVHQPGYYFSGADSALQHLDLVMLTNGWRRFRWDDVLAGKFPVLKHQPEDYMAIQGKVSGIGRAELAQKQVTGLIETKGGREFVTVPVRPDGTFTFGDILFYDTAKVYYQFNNDKDKILTSRGVFQFSNDLFNQPIASKPKSERFILPVRQDSSLLNKNTALNAKRLTQEQDNRKVQTLATVEVKAQQKTKEQKLEEQYVSGMFGGDGRIFDIGDDPVAQSSMNLFQYLQGRVAGLQISGASNMGSMPTLTWRGSQVGLFLNEIQQMDPGAIMSIPMSDVAMVKVFSPPFFGGGGAGAGGAVAVYTKKGVSEPTAKGLSAMNVAGYSYVKEFYSPDYSKYQPSANETVDYRTTLYWNPFVVTDKQNRRVFITFYNNDVTSKYRVVIEGCNAEGRLTRIEKIFQ